MLRQLNEWDKPIVFEYLLRNEEDASFLIGNAVKCGIMNKSSILHCGDYFGYFEANVLRGVIAFYNLGNCIPHYESFGAIPYFSRLMIMRRFAMLLGADRVVRPLYESIKHYKALREFEECSYCINSDLKPFKLEGVEFFDAAPDNAENVRFIRQAYLQGFGAERSIEGTKLLLSQRGEEEDFIILAKDNKLLSQACIQTFTPNTSQIGAVYTLEEERGKGYAKAVVSELCERIINRRKLPTLIVNKRNASALKTYEALGFEYRDDYLIVRL